MRRPCFAEGDVGLACITITEPAEFSGTTTNNNNNNNNNNSTTYNNNHNYPFFSRSRRSSYRSLSTFSTSTSSPRSSARLYDARCEEHHQPHFLEACFLCKKPLGDNRDIFMYRGDTPFCSEECRQEQIEIDEAKEKKYNLSVSMKAMRKETSKTTANKSRNYQARTSPVAAS